MIRSTATLQTKSAKIVFLVLAFLSGSQAAAALLPPAALNAFTNYLDARTNYQAHLGNATSAWKFARACFDWAEFATNVSQRASMAHEGISAAQLAVDIAPREAAGYLYLALNIGQLARTKSVGALPLVKEMEKTLINSIRLDPKFDFAAAHRTLGMLYLDAPGWPVSIGSNSKARQHLEKAVALAPDYPDNHLTFMEALVRWEELDGLRAAMARYQKILPEAKSRFSGSTREHDWKDWDKRWSDIQENFRKLPG